MHIPLEAKELFPVHPEANATNASTITIRSLYVTKFDYLEMLGASQVINDFIFPSLFVDIAMESRRNQKTYFCHLDPKYFDYCSYSLLFIESLKASVTAACSTITFI